MNHRGEGRDSRKPVTRIAKVRDVRLSTNCSPLPAAAFKLWACAIVGAVWWISSPVALAWASKKKEAEEVVTKSYTMPYLIVIMVIALGLMAVCRPGSRVDKSEDQPKKKEG